jgi:hypothetical protein
MKSMILVIVVFFCSPGVYGQIHFSAGGLQIGINNKGEVTNISHSAGYNYVPEKNPGFLLRIRSTSNEILNPLSVRIQRSILTFAFKDGIEIRVEARAVSGEPSGYLRFEVLNIRKPERIYGILWGPVNTSISETIGEVVGVVRDQNIAIGLRSLNTKTIGGKLMNDAGATAGYAGITGSTATKETFGSALQAFCLNHALPRRIDVPFFPSADIPPIEGYDMVGTAIAIFGTQPGNALQAIGQISRSEGLPFPLMGNEWVRTSPLRGSPYLITGFTEANFDEMLALTERLGFYCIYHENPFVTWGHFDLMKEDFPNGLEGMKACVEKANARGILVGVHTLTNFITTNDPFVTTTANTGLMSYGATILTGYVDEKATRIPIEDTTFFTRASSLNAVLIGNEIIRYREVSRQRPFELIDCVRGAYTTQAVAHAKGEKIKKLMDHPYNTFFPDWKLQDSMIQNLADFFNQTGVSQLDFDGHEGALYTGYGDYGTNYFASEFLKKVNHNVVNGSSIINHFYWNNNSYINWGEPWYGSFRQSQQEHRFSLQPFFGRNYMPNMLGWFLLTPSTSVEDVEWMMSVAAGYRAGYALVVSYKTYTTNPDMDRIIETIVSWEEAKKLNIFSETQQQLLKDTLYDFHLEKHTDHQWVLQYYDKTWFRYTTTERQPGEPVYQIWEFNNNGAEQPIHLQLQMFGENGPAENIRIELDNYFSFPIPEKLKKGESIVWDGSSQLKMYSEKGRFLKTITIASGILPLSTGIHRIKVQTNPIEGDDSYLQGIIKLKGKSEEISL